MGIKTMGLRTLSPSEVLNTIRLFECVVRDYFAPKDERNVIVMHAINYPPVLWKSGRHHVAIRPLSHPETSLSMEFWLHRGAPTYAPADPEWDECAKRMSKDLKKGTVLTNRNAHPFKAKVLLTTRRFEDARRVGYNDVYVLQAPDSDTYIDEHGYLQNRPKEHDPLSVAEV